MKKLLFATFNKNKQREAASLLESMVSMVTPSEVGLTDEPDETAETLEGNALIKARFGYKTTGLPCFADDTGLEVAQLNGAPGVHSARYAGENHNDEANRLKLLHELISFPQPHIACFRTVIAYIDADGVEHLFEGKVEGRIIPIERGTHGFGYDSLFVPDGFDRTFAQMTDNEKNTISHRARALEQFKQFLH